MTAHEALGKPIKVGTIKLKHRVAMAPLTRFRAHKNHTHSKLAVEYYRQRASTPGTLIITEATFINAAASGYRNVPGAYNDDQLKIWKEIIDAVHSQGSYIYLQLWALGRAALHKVLSSEGPYDNVSASNIPIPVAAGARSSDKPRALSKEEIKEYVQWYAKAAKAFVDAGGDGVEVHGANGYLVDQFTQKNSNDRTDEYGGSVENRTRFALEVVDACAKAVGPERVGIRLSPHSEFQGMRMGRDDIVETFSYLVTRLKEKHPELSYVHLTTPRVAGGADAQPADGDDLEFLIKIWGDKKPFLVAGGFSPDSASAFVEKHPNAVIAFGRHFIANPDLPIRAIKGFALNKYNRKTFYTEGPDQPVGYVDYPFLDQAITSKL
ncbi:FMN-linked oxidoreductase [Meredithblackwellia eburnea MCA 4105]